MNKEKLYIAAVYLRLSRDDIILKNGDKEERNYKTESNSICFQRELAYSFIRNNKDMKLFDTYIDDGYSGVDFDRPAFKRMINDIKAGFINCVIVKDLSRFGRDYIETGRFIQKIFPALNVRFIAINDCFDTLTADFNETSVVLPVKNFVNDSYCRDISWKVKSHQKVKRENGEFIGAFAVYGYKKDKKNKNLLVVDEYAAKVVQNIFAWKLEGYSFLAIADKLNSQGILSPMEYKKSKGENFQTGFCTKSIAKWSAMAVKRILVNEVYIGNLVQGKREKVNYKVKKSITKPENEWIRAENAHEAIIGVEDFKTVKTMLSLDSRAIQGQKNSHIFSGLLFCGDCMETMTRRTNPYRGKKTIYFICQKNNKGQGCSRHSIKEDQLKAIIAACLKVQVSVMLDKANVFDTEKEWRADIQQIVSFENECSRLKREQEKYVELKECLYRDWKEGIFSKEEFLDLKRIYKEKYAGLQKMIEQQEKRIQELFYISLITDAQLKELKTVAALIQINREVLLHFIERIIIYEDKRLCIEFRYQDLFDTANLFKYQQQIDINGEMNG